MMGHQSWQPTHIGSVVPTTGGMWQGSCTCGWQGSVWVNRQVAVEAKEEHLRASMQADPMTKWSAWMQMDLIDEPRGPEKA
jgi:hypothetical protein